MECPKGMRNGPCGGSTSEKCYIDETRPCIWYRIYRRAFRMGREHMLLEVLPPLDWDKVGTETWADVVRQVRKFGTWKFFRSIFSKDKEYKKESWQTVFRPIRQPDWWDGDSEYHEPAYSEPVSLLERRLRAGEFVITAEVSPPAGADAGVLTRNIELLKNITTAVNFTDGASAKPYMSSAACCSVAAKLGADPVLQIAARDKTRTGLQSDIIGANLLGINNVLCITGDNARIGPSPTSNTNILDMDAVQMLWIIRKMRDERKYLDGREIKSPPRIFLGAAASPFASEPAFQALREEKKVNAGAQFFQTNIIFDADGIDPWLEEIEKRGFMDRVYILAGVTPIRSLNMACYLNDKVPGVRVPDKIMKRLEDSKPGDIQEVGIQITLEIIEKLKQKKGINGLHIMSVGWESVVPRLLEESGLIKK